MSRRALPLVVLAGLLGGLTVLFLVQGGERTEPPAPLVGGPLVSAAAHVVMLDDGPDARLTAQRLVDSVMDAAVGSARAPVLEALRHPHDAARWLGLLAVPRYGPPDEELTAALRPLLTSEAVRVRRLAASAYGYLGEAYHEVEDDLVAAAEDPDAEVRALALATMSSRTRRAATLWPQILPRTADEASAVRAGAAKLLARIELREALAPGDIATVRAALVPLLADEHDEVRMYAVMALGRAGEYAAPDVPTMLRMLADPNALVRGTAANAVGDIGPSALPAIRAVLPSAGPEQAASLLWSLRLIGVAAIPLLREVLARPEATLQVQAALKLWELEEPVEPTVAVLLAALQNEDTDAVRLAARGLARLGTAGAPARDQLQSLLSHQDEVVRSAARAALERIGGEAEEGDR
ncbi:MAG: HEAT repeat domain-containing protein [Planctomycetota bacterium]|nr:HEAT repeat domain-containing protein [Planctomycetota bacterium]